MQGDSTALRYIAVYMYIWGDKESIITMYLLINEDFECIIIVCMKIHADKQNVCTFIVIYKDMLWDKK